MGGGHTCCCFSVRRQPRKRTPGRRAHMKKGSYISMNNHSTPKLWGDILYYVIPLPLTILKPCPPAPPPLLTPMVVFDFRGSYRLWINIIDLPISVSYFYSFPWEWLYLIHINNAVANFLFLKNIHLIPSRYSYREHYYIKICCCPYAVCSGRCSYGYTVSKDPVQ